MGPANIFPFPRREIEVDFIFSGRRSPWKTDKKIYNKQNKFLQNNSRNLSFSSTANTQSFKCHFSEYHYNFKNSCNFFWQRWVKCCERFRQRRGCSVVVITQTVDSAVIIVCGYCFYILIQYMALRRFSGIIERTCVCLCVRFAKSAASWMPLFVTQREGYLFLIFLKKMNTRNVQV